MAETWLFKDLDDLTRKVTWLANVMSNTAITIIGDYDELRPILNHIIKHTDFELFNVEFMEPMWANYEGEYGITLDADKSITVEKAIHIHNDGKEVAILFDSIIFAYKDVDERILKENESHILFDIEGEDDDTDDEVEATKSEVDKVMELLKKKNDEPKKVTKTVDLFDLLFS